MTELLDRVLSPACLRQVIRAKCNAGVCSQTISQLIACYVPANIAGDDRSRRLHVELIPAHQRMAFLEAVQRLPTPRGTAASKIATLHT